MVSGRPALGILEWSDAKAKGVFFSLLWRPQLWHMRVSVCWWQLQQVTTGPTEQLPYSGHKETCGPPFLMGVERARARGDFLGSDCCKLL